MNGGDDDPLRVRGTADSPELDMRGKWYWKIELQWQRALVKVIVISSILFGTITQMMSLICWVEVDKLLSSFVVKKSVFPLRQCLIGFWIKGAFDSFVFDEVIWIISPRLHLLFFAPTYLQDKWLQPAYFYDSIWISSKDETTFKWLNSLKSPRIAEFYKLTQIHKPNLAGQPNSFR